MGADVGTSNPYISYTTYPDIMGPVSLYEERGNPFDPGGGCGTLDGLPIGCSELRMRMQGGSVEASYPGLRERDPNQSSRDPRPPRYVTPTRPISDYGVGLYGVWMPSLFQNERSGPGLVFFTLPQESRPWVFNVGIHGFTEGELDRLTRAFNRVKSKACKDWFEATIKALGKPDLSVESSRPKTMDKLLEYAEFNKYDPKLTAKEMRIDQGRRDVITNNYENLWTNFYIANAVTLAPDFTRIYLMPSAFWDDTMLAPYSGRDLSGIIAFELLHVAGFGDDAIEKHRDALQKHCGIPSDHL